MTPAARVEAAITILDRILDGEAAEPALLRWSRASRFAGSGDRTAIRDLVFDSLRRLHSRAALGGGMNGRALMLGMCREQDQDPAAFFTGERHAPAALRQAELANGGTAISDALCDLPEWIRSQWLAALGDDANMIADRMRERAPVWLRVNLRRAAPMQAITSLASDGIEVRQHSELKTALCVLSGARRVANSCAYREGMVELQDLSPQLACDLLPRHGSLLDYCAGGGGKALALVAQGLGPAVAHDADPARMADLPVRAKRAGATIRIAGAGQISGRFDLVVADVPCSGSGTWRRTPDAKWRLSPADLSRLVVLQGQILREAAQFVAPGGALAYMTCSLLDCENSDQITQFLRDLPDFVRGKERLFTPQFASDGFYLCLMHRH